MTPDEVMCRAYPTMLKGAARVWFNKIPPGTITKFEQFSKGFVRHIIGGQRHKKQTDHLLNIQQAEGKSLREVAKIRQKNGAIQIPTEGRPGQNSSGKG